jgi:hypothetical protein
MGNSRCRKKRARLLCINLRIGRLELRYITKRRFLITLNFHWEEAVRILKKERLPIGLIITDWRMWVLKRFLQIEWPIKESLRHQS